MNKVEVYKNMWYVYYLDDWWILISKSNLHRVIKNELWTIIPRLLTESVTIDTNLNLFMHHFIAKQSWMYLDTSVINTGIIPGPELIYKVLPLRKSASSEESGRSSSAIMEGIPRRVCYLESKWYPTCYCGSLRGRYCFADVSQGHWFWNMWGK